MSEGSIFNIQKFSVHDGPGIRTTVFFKGCPLDCKWCHNPESKAKKPQLLYDESKCVLCKKCELVCDINCHSFAEGKHKISFNQCICCKKCVNACPNEALKTVGDSACVDYIIDKVMQDKSYYDASDGGITLSGGEPMFQADFALELAKAAKEKGLHTCMETCGYARAESFKEIAAYIDLFLYDFKLSDNDEHVYYTGVSNDLISDNLKLLDSMGKKIILRCPVICGVNDTQGHFEAIAELANELKNILEIHIEPYHDLGRDKAKKIGSEYPKNFSSPSEEQISNWICFLEKNTQIPIKRN